MCLNISTVLNIKLLTNLAAFLSVVLITEMLEICIQTSYDQNVQLILKSYLPVVYGTPLRWDTILEIPPVQLFTYMYDYEQIYENLSDRKVLIQADIYQFKKSLPYSSYTLTSKI